MKEHNFSLTVDYPSDRLDSYLALKLSKSRSFIQEQIKSGHILVNQKQLKPGHTLKRGDIITGALLEKTEQTLEPVEKKLPILFEDDFLMVINKPQGWLVHPASTTQEDTLVHYLLHHLKQSGHFKEQSGIRPGIVHRLDRGTSGVLLIAKTREAHAHLSAQFKERTTKKEYSAICWGAFKKTSGRYSSLIGRDPKDRKKMASLKIEGRESETLYEVTENFSNFSLVKLLPKTGRTHQLRVHLSEDLHPITGDTLYEKRFASKLLKECDETIQTFLAPITFPFLHAKRLEFKHPDTNAVLSFVADEPKEFIDFLEILRKIDK